MRLRQRQPEPGLLHADPLRKVNSRGSRNITGYVCSRKMPGRTLDHESPNELAFIRRAEIDPRVSEIYAQPVLIRHRDADGEWHDAFPDFVIRIDDRLEIHEVKPDGQYARPDVRAKLARIADAAERHGYAYSVALASELHRSSDASAIASVWRRLKTSVHPIALRVVEDALPRATFLRITLASHYLARVYWNHWRKDDRLVLLDIADEAIKPIELSFNKAELMRMVKREPDKAVDPDAAD